MLNALVQMHREQLECLAAGWLALGADALVLHCDNGVVAAWPEAAGQPQTGGEHAKTPGNASQSIGAPVLAADGRELGQLRLCLPPTAAGDEGPKAGCVSHESWGTQLAADAVLLGALAETAAELDSVVDALTATEDQLLALYELTRGGPSASAGRLDIDQMLQVTAQQAARLIKAQGTFVVLGARPIVQHPRPMTSEAPLYELFARVQAQGHPLLLTREAPAPDKGEGQVAPHAWPAQANSLFVAPLLRDEHGAVAACLGWWLDRPAATLSPDIKLARSIAEQAGAQLEIALLHEKLLAQAKLEAQLELARQVQLGLLPRRPPHILGLDLYAESRPALQVGGDFYDFYTCHGARGQRVGFAVGDVSGKGISAALLMAMSRTALRVVTSSLASARTPAEILSRTNADLYDDFSEVGMMASVFIGQYDAGRGQLTYANAGHSPVIFCPAGGPARLLEADGPMLGVLPQSLAENQTAPFGPGDVLVVLTDGFNEASGGSAGEGADTGAFFGIERLEQLVEATAHLPAAEIGQQLFAAVMHFARGHAQEDDQTLVVVKGVAASLPQQGQTQ
jgi:sigma-B regulation protein RsbU (phosphoserine phosphatase)